MKKLNINKRKIIKSVGRGALTFLSLCLIVSPVSAVEPVSDITKVASETMVIEAGKEALNSALKIARTKPMLSVAGLIVCLACPLQQELLQVPLCVSLVVFY